MRIDRCDVDSLARVHKALADETRLRIVNLMANRGEMCVCDVEGILETSQSKASRHLGYLRQAGIVQDRRDRTWVYYRLNKGAPPCVRSAIREIKKTLADDPIAQRDLERAKANVRAARCAPADEPAKQSSIARRA